MTRRVLTVALMLLLAVGPAWAQDAGAKTSATTETGEAEKSATECSRELIAGAMPSLARVEVWLKVDKGEDPPHSSTITEERPYEASALVLAPDKVLTQDMAFHPRFVKRITVRYGDQVVDAKPWAYMMNQDAMILQLDKPLAGGAKPLEFKADAEGPYISIPYYQRFGVWTASTEPISGDVCTNEQGVAYRSVKNYALIVNDEGVPAGIRYHKRLPTDGSWRGSPLEKPLLKVADYQKRLDALKTKCDNALVRVTLNLRSPKKGSSSGSRYSRYGSSSSGSATEKNVVGAIIDARTIVVMSSLTSNVTARLKKITAHLPGDKDVTATFKHTLKDWGCFLATLDEPVTDFAELSETPTTKMYKKLLLTADVRIQGPRRLVYYKHRRIHGYELSYHRDVYPNVKSNMYFDLDGRLVVMPMTRRTKGEGSRWSRGGNCLPSTMLREVLADLPNNIDSSNVPVIEQDESRVAWMGLILQPLTRDLARENKVSHLTSDGSSGAIVSYVYEDSPAAKAGVKQEWIFLRLQVEGEPKPLDVSVSEGYTRQFPWEYLDRIPVESFERAPTPWTKIESGFTRTLTEFGFGKKFTAQFFVDGKVITKDFVIVQSPTHYNTAAKYKSKTLELTVRDMTVEVRRYFQKTAKDAGVIISKIEPGSKAAVKGLKPYEIITEVDDQPVMTVKDFERLIKGKTEYRLSVLRRRTGRTVPIKLDKAEGADAEKAPEKAATK
jgi:serine protease Do